MRVHVTGERGFIGSHLCPALAAAGHDVRPALEGCDAVVHLAVSYTHLTLPTILRV